MATKRMRRSAEAYSLFVTGMDRWVTKSQRLWYGAAAAAAAALTTAAALVI